MSHCLGDQPDANARTIDTYDQHALEYIRNSPRSVSGWVKGWLDRAAAGLPHDARVLELGSGPGQDADYLHSLGYDVSRFFCYWTSPQIHDVLAQSGFADIDIQENRKPDFSPGWKDWLHITARKPTT